MYLLGTVDNKRVVNTTSYYTFCLANKQTLSDKRVTELIGKMAIWKVASAKTDKRGEKFYILDFIRLLTEEEENMLSYKMTMHITYDETEYYKRIADVLYTIGNLEEYLCSKDGSVEPVPVPRSEKLAKSNLLLWQDFYVNQKCSVNRLVEILDLPELVSFEAITLYAPDILPSKIRPQYCDRKGISKSHLTYNSPENYYVFNTPGSTSQIALTKEELLNHADRFDIPVTLTPLCNGYDILIAPKTSSIKEIHPLQAGRYRKELRCQIPEYNRSVSIDYSWVKEHMEYFKDFKFDDKYFVPIEDIAFKIEDIPYGMPLKPNAHATVIFPELEYSAQLPLSYIYTKIKGECLNGELYKEGNTLDTLRIVFETE